jgi:leucyl aminopeptidase
MTTFIPRVVPISTTTNLFEGQVDVLVLTIHPQADSAGTVRLGTAARHVDDVMGGRLRTGLAELCATGWQGEITIVPSMGASSASVLIMSGVPEDGTPADIRAAFATAVRNAPRGGHLLVAVDSHDGSTLSAAVEGALLSVYERDRTSSSSGAVFDRLTVCTEIGPPAALQEIRRAEASAKAVETARRLINAPAGDLPPAELAGFGAQAASDAGCEVEVLGPSELRALGLGGVIAVGAGSANPPCVLRVEHCPGGRPPIALVGKGVTYDAGGLVLKQRVQMETMKGDMAGAAAVLAAVLAAAELGIDQPITAWIACAENLPSGEGTRPGDVVTLRNGKRVEVLNTDAEGRVVLADVLAYACEREPRAIIDLGTLTGAGKVLGPLTAGLMSNDQELRDHVRDAAALAGEDIWPMPLSPYLAARLSSDVADLTNVARDGATDPNMLTAGVFLQQFVPHGMPWAHLDIPYFNFGSPVGDLGSGGLGFGTRTLLNILDRTA